MALASVDGSHHLAARGSYRKGHQGTGGSHGETERGPSLQRDPSFTATLLPGLG